MKRRQQLPFYLGLLLIAMSVSCNDSKNKHSAEEAIENTKEAVQDSEVDDEQSKNSTQEIPTDDLIQVDSPQPNTEITSPLMIKGKARGIWYFEGDFPIFLLDENEKEIGVAIAVAQGEWMTEDWVPFEANLEFEAPVLGKGFLLFQKSNPSDRRELDRSFRIPITFR